MANATRRAAWVRSMVAAVGMAGVGAGVAGAAPLVLTDGNAQLTLVGPTIFSTNLGDTTMLTGGTEPDQVYKYSWYYRTQNNNTNRVLSSLDTPSVSITGNQATITYLNAGPGVAGAERFDAVLRITLTDGAGPEQVRLESVMTITSRANTRRTWQFFNVGDFDLAGGSGATSVDDIGVLVEPGLIRTTEASSERFAEHWAENATRYDVDTGSAIRSRVGGGAFNLTLNNGPINGDVAGAYQWTLTLDPGESVVIRTSWALNMPAVAPPGCPCPADYNGSGSSVPDIDDLIKFFEDFNEGDSVTTDGDPSADVDCTGVGSVPDVDDILTFFDAFLNGC